VSCLGYVTLREATRFKKAFECYTTCKDSDEEEDDDDIEEPVSDINKERTDNSNTITTCTTCFSHLEFGGNSRH